MSKLQINILNDYKKTYPADSLKDISQRTHIQITRVFRLFNGSEMKISELEAFQNVLHKFAQKNSLTYLIEECSEKIPQSKIASIVKELQVLLKIESYKSEARTKLKLIS